MKILFIYETDAIIDDELTLKTLKYFESTMIHHEIDHAIICGRENYIDPNYPDIAYIKDDDEMARILKDNLGNYEKVVYINDYTAFPVSNKRFDKLLQNSCYGTKTAGPYIMQMTEAIDLFELGTLPQTLKPLIKCKDKMHPKADCLYDVTYIKEEFRKDFVYIDNDEAARQLGEELGEKFGNFIGNIVSAIWITIVFCFQLSIRFLAYPFLIFGWIFGVTTWRQQTVVRAHRRSNGSYVQSHSRSFGPTYVDEGLRNWCTARLSDKGYLSYISMVIYFFLIIGGAQNPTTSDVENQKPVSVSFEYPSSKDSLKSNENMEYKPFDCNIIIQNTLSFDIENCAIHKANRNDILGLNPEIFIIHFDDGHDISNSYFENYKPYYLYYNTEKAFNKSPIIIFVKKGFNNQIKLNQIYNDKNYGKYSGGYL